MRLLTLLRDLFNVKISSVTAWRILRETAQLEREREERYHSINRSIWEYKNSPARLLELDSSDESIRRKAMTEFDALQLIYEYRHNPDVAAVPEILALTRRERFLRTREGNVAIGWSGVIVALCERHPEKVKQWEETYGETITQACRVANHPSSFNSPQWADHLAFRWLILGTDKAAWVLLCRAHHGNKDIRNAAQTAIENICKGIELCDRDGHPVLDSQGTVLGIVKFEDMRQTILRLAKEFTKLSRKQRSLPFEVIPFTAEYRLYQRAQREGLAGLAAARPATRVLQ